MFEVGTSVRLLERLGSYQAGATGRVIGCPRAGEFMLEFADGRHLVVSSAALGPATAPQDDDVAEVSPDADRDAASAATR